MKYLHGM